MAATSAGVGRLAAAVALGAAAFVCFSYLRIQIQSTAPPAPLLGVALTLLMYLIPGAVVGCLVPRSPLVPGALLGLLTAPVVWFEVGLRLNSRFWSGLAEISLGVAALGLVGCLAGSVGAAYICRRRSDL